LIAWASTSASWGPLNIFQLPATSLRRRISPSAAA